MQVGSKHLLVIGDRLLVRPETADDKSKSGLILPQTVVENQPVQSGRVLEVGPGIAYPNMNPESDEPWQEGSPHSTPVRFMPVQLEVGDLAIFLRKEAVEIRYIGEKFLVVPQQAVMLVIRGDDVV